MAAALRSAMVHMHCRMAGPVHRFAFIRGDKAQSSIYVVNMEQKHVAPSNGLFQRIYVVFRYRLICGDLLNMQGLRSQYFQPSPRCIL
ncbi:MAG TPA: hypothetical protein VLA28_11070, partial [Afifellaceae bacterium]|nr:hypothetical protein [Afifellaceae bacterium]